MKSEQLRMALLGVVAAAVAFFVMGGLSVLSPSGTSDPYDAVPKDSFLVGTMELAELRASPIYGVIFGGADRKKGSLVSAQELGMGKLAETCGFDPIARVDRLAVAVPEEGDKGEFGLAAKVNVTRDELERCTGAVTSGGSKVETKDVGSFIVVEDTKSETARSRLAYGAGGLLVVGRGTWFDAMLAAADRKKPGSVPAHAAMRALLTGQPGFQHPTMLVTAILPRSVRDRLRNEMAGEAAGDPAGNEMMAGVLGVSSAGIAIKTAGEKNTVEAEIELVCDTEDACAAVEKLILKKRLDWSKEIALRFVGLGPLIDSVEVKRSGMQVRVTAGMWADALATSIERVLKFRGGGGGGGPTERREPPPASKMPGR